MGKSATRFVTSWPEYLYVLLKGPVTYTFAFLLIFELSQHTVRTAVHFLISDLDQTTPGTIVESRVDSGAKYQPTVRDIEYTYVVGESVYRSSMIDYTQRGYNPEEYVKRYSIGDEVVVFYDSQFPTLSILQKSNFNLGLVGSLCFALVIFSLGIAWGVWVSGPKFISS